MVCVKSDSSVAGPAASSSRRTRLLIPILAVLAVALGALAIKAAGGNRVAARVAPVKPDTAPSLAAASPGENLVPTTDGTLQPPPADPAPPTATPRTGHLRIAGAGDIMLQRRINRSARQKSKGEENNNGYDGLFRDVAPALAGVDFATANMEFPVFDKRMSERAYVFHGEPPMLKAIMAAGFPIVTSANNHAYDHGRISPESTKRLCDAAGLVCLGVGATREEAERPYIVEKNGIKVAFIGYTMLYNSNQNRSDPAVARVNGYKWDDLVRQVKAAREQADAVIVNVHWGQEYRTTPLSWQPRQARALFDAGATVIFGHHSHVLEPVQLMEASDGRHCLVAYSLSNFLSNQNGSTPTAITRLGAIVKVDLARTARGVEVESWSSEASWVENHDVKVDGQRIEDVHVEIAPVQIELLEKKLAEEQDPARQAALRKSIAFYEGRQAHAERILKNPSGRVDPPEESKAPVAAAE